MATPDFIDLHCHTTFSDGSYEPEEVVQLATAAGVTTLAITDHDEVRYWDRASDAAEAAGITLIAGVELSIEFRGKEVHLLGFGFDPEDASLRDALQQFRDARRARGKRIIGKLQRLGLKLELDDVVPPDFNGAIGRPHFARALHRTGQVSSVQEAFDLYLANGKPGAEPKVLIEPERGCRLIREAGGVPVLAHPVFYHAEEWIGGLVDLGLGGIEVLHSSHSDADARLYTEIADRYGLVKTGGSDFHGAAKPDVHFGDVRMPTEWWEPLETAIGDSQAAATA